MRDRLARQPGAEGVRFRPLTLAAVASAGLLCAATSVAAQGVEFASLQTTSWTQLSQRFMGDRTGVVVSEPGPIQTAGWFDTPKYPPEDRGTGLRIETPALGAEELGYIIGHAEPRVVVTDTDTDARMAALGVPTALGASLADGQGADLPAVTIDADDHSTLLYTSGTTGKP